MSDNTITAQMIKDAAENIDLVYYRGGYAPRDEMRYAAVKIADDQQSNCQTHVWLWRLAIAVAVQISMEHDEASDIEDALENLTVEPRLDQLGKSVIIYWPSIEHDTGLD